MGDPLKVSVITASLDRAHVLGRCIDSVRSQSYPHIELVIVDGGSTDGTSDLLAARSHEVDVVVQERDDGIYDALNKGLARCTGDLVYVLGTDDELHDRQVVQAVVEVAKAHPSAMVVYGDTLVVEPTGETRLVRADRVSRRTLKTKTIIHQALFARRRVFDITGPFDTSYRLTADYAWLLRALVRHRLEARYIPRVVCRYAASGASGTRSTREEKLRAIRTELGLVDRVLYPLRRRLHLRARPFRVLPPLPVTLGVNVTT